MKIKILKIEEIKEYANNPRKVDKSVKALIKSIKQFGFRIPLVVDKDNIIVCGHARVIAAKKLGLKELPCVIVTDLTEEQIRAYRIADNQVAAYATWDEEQLQAEL
ncbi:MAG: ParB N-terminal domain-containing protein, partial [Phascolarctobacterium sp.]|nr:ParB N-terminal domain-containing protein [Candidatus Phascolarctobacterium caballi]